MKLDRLIEKAQMTRFAVARQANIDGSMITHIIRGGGCSYRVALAIADVVIGHVPALRTEAYLWMLSIGYAPRCLATASQDKKRQALACVGVTL